MNYWLRMLNKATTVNKNCHPLRFACGRNDIIADVIASPTRCVALAGRGNLHGTFKEAFTGNYCKNNGIQPG